jgi:endopeptidase La
MNEDLKKYKLYFLQLKYSRIINIINCLKIHNNNLFHLNLLDLTQNLDYSTKLYNIIKNLNTYYNQYINYYFENTNTDIDELYNSIKDISCSNILKVIKQYELDLPSNVFNSTNNAINELIKKYGYTDIISLLKIVYPEIKLNNVITLLEELNDIVIPLSLNIFEVNSENVEYYWRVPKTFNSTDVFEKTRELWIRKEVNGTKNIYFKINLVFLIDKFSSKIKTTQIKSPYLNKKKTQILQNVENSNIDGRFLKSLLTHDYLGNIYCLDINEYQNYINTMYSHYTKLIESTFVNIMKEFVSYNNLTQMYNIIFLLLLGTVDTIEIAGLLIGLIKEKNNKTESRYNLYESLYNNLTFYLQSKIKKSNNVIKQSVNKLKVNNIDYKKLLSINKNIPNNVKSLVLEKIEEMKTPNNEYYKQLTFVKTIINYPWSSLNDDIFYNNMKNNSKLAMEYLNKVETKLQESCYGHSDAKKLLLQMIGKWISNPASSGTCFGLVGPPGVGKTLLAKSVSKALDIPFAQITLGGQNDGEILHGHGYTYSGSQPGMVIKKMVEMGKSRCILYFDELDKACSKHGSINEITSILIHLTDPNMNKTFQDRFFQGIEFPLDKVIMIFSYNDSKLVDTILLDRLKEIKVEPYTIEDKINICQNHIIKEISSSVSMENIVTFDNNILEYIIENYTNEAGVREIKRKIEDIYMNLNIDRIYKRNQFNKSINTLKLNKKIITTILKDENINKRLINKESMIGIVNGLYATSNGEGGITSIQIYPNLQSTDKYDIKLTGKQGDTMKESVICSLTVALEWLKKKYNIEELMKTSFKSGFHVHTPEGATPKDGPSAGCAFTIAFISRILNRPVKNNIAMTGEIELTGKISKIGGLEFKLQGAKKAGITIVYVPAENSKDIEDIKKKYKNLITDKFQVKLVNTIDCMIGDILL